MTTLYCYYRLYSSANGQRLTHLVVLINSECDLSTKRLTYLIHDSRQKVSEAMESLIMCQALRAVNALCSEKYYVSDRSLRAAAEVDIKLISQQFGWSAGLDVRCYRASHFRALPFPIPRNSFFYHAVRQLVDWSGRARYSDRVTQNEVDHLVTCRLHSIRKENNSTKYVVSHSVVIVNY